MRPEIDPKTWFVFIWAAIFSGVAIVLRVARELTHKKPITSREVARAVIDILTVVFFGGLFGWAMAIVFPGVTNNYPTIIAIGAALISYSGLTASQDALYRLFARATGLPLRREGDDAGYSERQPPERR